MKKKFVVMLLTAAVVMSSLAACSSSSSDTSSDTGSTEETETEEEETAEAEETEESEETTETADTGEIPAAVTLSDSTALEGLKIGCSIVYKGDEFCSTASDALETLGAYYGCDITVEDGDANDETQTKQIENMIANGCDMIIVDPMTPDGSSEALNKAVEAGIPVIIFDSYWTDGEEKAVTTVTWDQYDSGVMAAEYFVDYVEENYDGAATVVELANLTSTHCQERFDGFHDVIDEANANGMEITIINQYDNGAGNRETSYNAIAAVVEPYDFVISDVDNGAQGAVSALKALGKTDVKVISMGAYGEEPFTELYEEDDNYLACLNVDPWILAQFVFDGAIAYFEGDEVETTVNIDLYMVDSSNVEEFWSF